MARVTKYVHAVNPETGEVTVLKPGDEIPKELEGVVTNPSVLGGGAPEAPADPYGGMKNTDLRALLEDRDLPTSGNQAELIGRLREHDASK